MHILLYWIEEAARWAHKPLCAIGWHRWGWRYAKSWDDTEMWQQCCECDKEIHVGTQRETCP